MLTLIRIAIWAFPLVGLLKKQDTPREDRSFTPGGAAEDLARISQSIRNHAATLPPESAAALDAIARKAQEARDEVLVWGNNVTPRRASRLFRIFRPR